MIVVHHLDHSRSHRALWLLEELGLEYEMRTYARDPKTMLAPPELRAIHPLGKAPVIVDDGRTIAESGAIIEYLVDSYGEGRLRPAAGTPDRLHYTYFLHYAEGSMMTPLLLRLLFMRMPAGASALLRPIVRGISTKTLTTYVDPQIQRHLDFLEGELNERPWFAGDDFSAADIQMSFPVEGVGSVGGLGPRKRLADFVTRIRARPAYQRALAKGGPVVF
jgi:glutathione S-transferase